MAEGNMRRTQARMEERMRRRAEQERSARLKRMIPLGILGALAVIAIGFVLFGTLRTSGALDNPNGKPKFTVDSEKLELGDQKLGHAIKASFKVTNTGDARLTLNAPSMVTALEGC